MSDSHARSMPIVSFHHLASATLLSLLLIGVLPGRLEAAGRGGGGKTEVLPMQKAAPAAVFIETPGTETELRRQLRAKNGVVELGQSTPHVLFSQAPTGAFGFIAPKVLGLGLVTQNPDMGLERVAPAPNAYEIHKLADGSGMLVGFVAHDLMTQVAPSQRPKSIRLALYSNPSDQATHIVAVPLVKLAADRMPIRLDPKNPDSPVMFDMDLQSSTNRLSTQGGQ
jgi:hypothetical protein